MKLTKEEMIKALKYAITEFKSPSGNYFMCIAIEFSCLELIHKNVKATVIPGFTRENFHKFVKDNYPNSISLTLEDVSWLKNTSTKVTTIRKAFLKKLLNDLITES